jgi:hypothetical protein
MMVYLYTVVTSKDLAQFNNEVSDYLRSGWKCQGGVNVMERLDTTNAKYNMPCYMITTYSQAVVFEGDVTIGEEVTDA